MGNLETTTPANSILVLGNCQVPVLGSFLETLHPNLNFYAVQTFSVPDFNFTKENLDRFMHIVAFPLFDIDPVFNYDNLRKRSNVTFVSNLYYTGLHPDMTYLGAPSGRILGLMGDYHSIVVFASFMLGKSENHVLENFDQSVERLFADDDWNSGSLDRLKRRDELADIKSYDLVQNATPIVKTFYTINHPSWSTYLTFAHRVSQRLEQLFPGSRDDFSAKINGTRDPLGENYIWPIYPYVKKRLNLAYGGDYDFRLSAEKGLRTAKLSELIAHDYAVYKSVGIDMIKAAGEYKSLTRFIDLLR